MNTLAPQTPIETLLQTAMDGKLPIRAFMQAFVASEVVLLTGSLVTPDGSGFDPLLFDKQGVLHVAVFTVDTASPLAGRSLMEVHLRREHDLTVAAARRGEEFVPNPDGPFVLSPGDRLYVMGTAEAMKKGAGLFRGA